MSFAKSLIVLWLLMFFSAWAMGTCTVNISTSTVSNVSCNGASDGLIDITISGAQGNITYLWNDGITTEDRNGLQAGTYTVTVTDDIEANCTFQQSFTVTEPAALKITGIVTNATTPGGSDGAITLNMVSGGTMPYSYLWSSGATTKDISNLMAGTYTVTLTDAHNCTLSDTFFVADADCQIQVFPSDPAICSNSGSGIQLVVTALGATAFEWSPASGLNATTGVSVIATPVATQAYTVTATNLLNCSATVIVKVNPLPLVNPVTDTTYCNAAQGAMIPFSSSVPNAEFHWTCDLNIGFGTSGTGPIPSFTASNVLEITQVAQVTVYATASDCIGPTNSFKITVNPTPNILAVPDYEFCNGESSPAIEFTSNVAGATFDWSSKNNVDVGFGTSGIGNIAAFIATNDSSDLIFSNIKVVATAEGCSGADSKTKFTISVAPSPVIDVINNQAFCNGETVAAISFSSEPAADQFYWTSSAGNIGFGVSGVGNIPAFNAVNTGTGNITSTITVYATKSGCQGPDQTFTITIVPAPTFTSSKFESVCNESPFNYTATTNTNATVSWNRPVVAGIFPLQGMGNSAVINDTLKNMTDNPVLVKYIFTLNNGASCIGYDTLYLTVFPTPKLLSPTIESVCDGSPFVYLAVSATPGASISWTRPAVVGISNPAGSDTTNLVNETLNNTTDNNISVTYTFNLATMGCPSNSQDVVVTVKATPILNDTTLIYNICNDATFSTQLSTNTPNTSFSWQRFAVTGITPDTDSGDSDSISDSLHNATALPVTTFYFVTTSHQGCENIDVLFVTVDPTLSLNSDTSVEICDSTALVYQAASATPGIQFNWTRAAVAGISNPMATGTGSLINETLKNTTNDAVTVTYVFTLTIDTCSYQQNLHVKVYPTPYTNAVSNKLFCNGITTVVVPFSGNVANAEFHWTSTQDIGFGMSGTGSIPSFTVNNPGTLPVVDTIKVYATANGCDGPAVVFTITLNPTTKLTGNLISTICDSTTFTYAAACATPGVFFSWNRLAADGITPATNTGSSNLINETLYNSKDVPVTVTYVYNLTLDTCTNQDTVHLTVNPTPKLNSVVDTSICDGAVFNYLATSLTPGTNFSWKRDSIPGIGNPAAVGTGNTVSETLYNQTDYTPLSTLYDFTMTFTNNGITCDNHQLVKVQVNPSPPLPAFTSLAAAPVPISVCGGSENVNFNVDVPQGVNGVTYLWTANPASAVEIGNASNPNTVISFKNTTGQVQINVYAHNTDSLGGCPDSISQIVTIVANPDSIAERKIILKQPGNLLVYPDNSMAADSGYQWGYDLKISEEILGPPHDIAGQVYQFFTPEPVYLKDAKLDTFKYAFWVLLKRGGCRSKVYYNGPYAHQKLADDGDPGALPQVKIYPNPNTGSFNVTLKGNMYGTIEAKIYNILGATLYNTTFEKTNYESNEKMVLPEIPNGIYYLELNSSDQHTIAARMLIAH